MKKWTCTVLAVAFALAPLSALAQQEGKLVGPFGPWRAQLMSASQSEDACEFSATENQNIEELEAMRDEAIDLQDKVGNNQKQRLIAYMAEELANYRLAMTSALETTSTDNPAALDRIVTKYTENIERANRLLRDWGQEIGVEGEEGEDVANGLANSPSKLIMGHIDFLLDNTQFEEEVLKAPYSGVQSYSSLINKLEEARSGLENIVNDENHPLTENEAAAAAVAMEYVDMHLHFVELAQYVGVQGVENFCELRSAFATDITNMQTIMKWARETLTDEDQSGEEDATPIIY